MKKPRYASLAARLYVPEIVKGLLVTGRHLVQNLLRPSRIPTIQYPEQKRVYSQRFRGAHVLKKREDGSLRCVACYMCATACPAICITIEAGEYKDAGVEKYPTRFDIDMLRCIFCGYCVDACPEDAIEMTGDSELCMTSRSQSVWNIDLLADRPQLEKAKPGWRPFYGIMQRLSPRSLRPRSVRTTQVAAGPHAH
ncbi:MAG: NADH-quinone oxidoreductase subunit I [Acidobacteriota bacterium]